MNPLYPVRRMSEYMGSLMGPRAKCEIVITLFEDDKINYQFEGMTGPVAPQVAYKLLAVVAQEVAQQMGPADITTITQETPVNE